MSRNPAYTFQVNWLSGDTTPDFPFYVTSFEGREAIAKPFVYTIDLISRSKPDSFRNILRRTAKLTMQREVQSAQGASQTTTRPLHGMLRSFELLGFDGTSYQYRAVLVPRLWRAMQMVRSKVYVNYNLFDLIEDTWSQKPDVPVDTDKSKIHHLNPVRDFTMQYMESNLNFLQRWLEFYGVSYFFKHEEDHEVAIFCNVKEGFLPLNMGAGNEVKYLPNDRRGNQREAISSVLWRDSLVPDSLTVVDFNKDTPTQSTREVIDVGSPGTGDHIEIDSDTSAYNVQDVLEVRRDEYHGMNYRVHGQSDVRSFCAGYTFKITDNPVAAASTEYLLIEVTHRGSQSVDISSGNASGVKYENDYVAIPNVLTYRPSRVTPRPVVHGLLHGVVENDDGAQYPGIDSEGRYRVRLFFDNDTSANNASAPIRKAEPYGGPDRGMHMPLINGTEVLVAFSGGDPDRPVIVAAVSGPSQKPPVINSNRDQTIIKTKATRMVMQDLQGEESITLSTEGTFAGQNLSVLTDASLSVGNSAKSLSNIASMAAMNTDISLMTKVMSGVVAVSITSMRQVGILAGYPLIQGAVVGLLTGMTIGYKYETDAKRSGSQPTGVANILMPILNLVLTLIIVQVQVKLLQRTIAKDLKLKMTPRAGAWPDRGKRLLFSTNAALTKVKQAASFIAGIFTLRSFTQAYAKAKAIDAGADEEVHGLSMVRAGDGAAVTVAGSGKSILIATDAGSIDMIARKDFTIHGNYALATAHSAIALQVIGEEHQASGCGITIGAKNVTMMGPGELPDMTIRVNEKFVALGHKMHGAFNTTGQGTGIMIKDGEGTFTGKELVLTTNDNKSGMYIGNAGLMISSREDGGIVIDSAVGKVTLSNSGIVVEDAKGVGIKIQAKGAVTVAATAKLELSGSQVAISGGQVSIDGSQVKINGQAVGAMGGKPAKPPVIKPKLPSPPSPPIVPLPPVVAEPAEGPADNASGARVSQIIKFFTSLKNMNK